ncbi:cellulose binding domain-containing protein [Catellatospora sp. KI3]|uniref:cellulose binding domain-containing protein n=1 Tax=Catellatospora sp. KI3 TaxID=3041620 RepID=UPI0024826953|nr:cellulose binding domain-containing protein [Catellatospora sp. KI3]MDI1464724.1 cellulose binding domain-containing protein [Catellatospora sp. KI3]
MRKRTSAIAAVAAATMAALGTAVVTGLPSYAAAGCTVTYNVTNQWPGGFGADVTVKNLGDPLSGWNLVWSYSGGQTVGQHWNATITQSGTQVTAVNVGYNGSVATNGTVNFGFNGSFTSSNPAPTSFRLNGVTCTGGVSGSPSPTRTAGPSPSRSISPSPSRSSGTPGVPSDAVWVASGQWDNWVNSGYTVYNNIWGSGAGSQTIWARTPTNWGVIANHPTTSGVKSYPHTVKGTVNRTVSSLGSMTSSFNVSVPGSGNYATTYDIWANNWAYEIMLWMNYNGAVGPIADQYDSNGAVPAFRNLSLGGHTWNVYRGNNGANAVFSFLRTSNTNSGTVDIRAILNWLRTQNWWGDVTVGEAQFGFEISGTNGSAAFTDNSFAISWS